MAGRPEGRVLRIGPGKAAGSPKVTVIDVEALQKKVEEIHAEEASRRIPNPVTFATRVYSGGPPSTNFNDHIVFFPVEIYAEEGEEGTRLSIRHEVGHRLAYGMPHDVVKGAELLLLGAAKLEEAMKANARQTSGGMINVFDQFKPQDLVNIFADLVITYQADKIDGLKIHDDSVIAKFGEEVSGTPLHYMALIEEKVLGRKLLSEKFRRFEDVSPELGRLADVVAESIRNIARTMTITFEEDWESIANTLSLMSELWFKWSSVERPQVNVVIQRGPLCPPIDANGGGLGCGGGGCNNNDPNGQEQGGGIAIPVQTDGDGDQGQLGGQGAQGQDKQGGGGQKQAQQGTQQGKQQGDQQGTQQGAQQGTQQGAQQGTQQGAQQGGQQGKQGGKKGGKQQGTQQGGQQGTQQGGQQGTQQGKGGDTVVVTGPCSIEVTITQDIIDDLVDLLKKLPRKLLEEIDSSNAVGASAGESEARILQEKIRQILNDRTQMLRSTFLRSVRGFSMSGLSQGDPFVIRRSVPWDRHSRDLDPESLAEYPDDVRKWRMFREQPVAYMKGTDRTAGFKEVIAVIDTSGSTSAEVRGGRVIDYICSTAASVAAYARRAAIPMSVVAFSGTATVIHKGAKVGYEENFQCIINDLAKVDADGDTNYGNALKAVESMRPSRKLVVFISDGEPGDIPAEEALGRMVEFAKKTGSRFVYILVSGNRDASITKDPRFLNNPYVDTAVVEPTSLNNFVIKWLLRAGRRRTMWAPWQRTQAQAPAQSQAKPQQAMSP